MCRRADRLQDRQKSDSRIREHPNGDTSVSDSRRSQRRDKSRKDSILELHTVQVPATFSRYTQTESDCRHPAGERSRCIAQRTEHIQGSTVRQTHTDHHRIPCHIQHIQESHGKGYQGLQDSNTEQQTVNMRTCL